MDKTEQKILDAALKVFSERGYDGAKTKLIANESGFTEMTLFRKFGTKENLLSQVLTENQKIILGDFNSVIAQSLAKNSDEQINFLIERVVEVVDHNFEYIKILLNEKQRISQTVIKGFIYHLSEHLAVISPQSQIDNKVLAFNILSFAYFIKFDRSHGRTFDNHENAVEEFIRYTTQCLKKEKE
ncbi:MAG: TetR/AcrR family transcriptional regulator [Methanobacteriaceae archaeon]